MERAEQREILQRRLVAAVADEYRFGAVCDLDYGGRPEKERELGGAEGRVEEVCAIARDLGLELAADAEVDELARAALRREYEGADDALAVLREAPTTAAAEPHALYEAEERVRERGPVLRYLDDAEEDRRWREALERGLGGEAAEVLRAAGYPEEKVGRFVRAGLDTDAGTPTEEAAERHRLNAGDLHAYLEERARAPHGAG